MKKNFYFVTENGKKSLITEGLIRVDEVKKKNKNLYNFYCSIINIILILQIHINHFLLLLELQGLYFTFLQI